MRSQNKGLLAALRGQKGWLAVWLVEGGLFSVLMVEGGLVGWPKDRGWLHHIVKNTLICMRAYLEINSMLLPIHTILAEV